MVNIVSALQDIPVRVEAASGNVTPLLHEIRHALRRVAQGGEGTTIDLGSLPLAPGEEKRIEDLLGQGEVRAELSALGPSVVQETRYPGVWFITHRNTEQEVVARFIEVTRMPELLFAQSDDMRRAVSELDRKLSGGNGDTPHDDH
ncbi:MAG TPA: hydrogenase expression/formation C-terminal domain-containing protein [Woeseiaceae bacterium]|nr:hydrogenase expression/formation C-terminal domain-containing protein [Woeseiaceae bacterium]